MRTWIGNVSVYYNSRFHPCYVYSGPVYRDIQTYYTVLQYIADESLQLDRVLSRKYRILTTTN